LWISKQKIITYNQPNRGKQGAKKIRNYRKDTMIAANFFHSRISQKFLIYTLDKNEQIIYEKRYTIGAKSFLLEKLLASYFVVEHILTTPSVHTVCFN
jgi:hypothetical protein